MARVVKVTGGVAAERVVACAQRMKSLFPGEEVFLPSIEPEEAEAYVNGQERKLERRLIKQGAEFRTYRERLGYSRERVARSLGIGGQDICRFESARLSISIHRRRRLGRLLEKWLDRILSSKQGRARMELASYSEQNPTAVWRDLENLVPVSEVTWRVLDDWQRYKAMTGGRRVGRESFPQPSAPRIMGTKRGGRGEIQAYVLWTGPGQTELWESQEIRQVYPHLLEDVEGTDQL